MIKTNATILLNLNETRRRSLMLWNSLPEENLHWRPDEKAMSAIEMIRHVLAADYGWNKIIRNEKIINSYTPWDDRPYLSVQDEIEFAQPYRKEFLMTIESFSEKELIENTVVHPGNGKVKQLLEYLLRIGYHEAVHAGNFLLYLRLMGCSRPNVWD